MALEPTPITPTRRQQLAPGEMTILEHLQELRGRVMWMAIAVALGMGVFFVPTIGFGAVDLLIEPARVAHPGFKPQYIEPMENIVTYFQVALLGGVAAGMPMIVFQTLRFVAPALTSSEKRWVYPIALGAAGAFIGGMAFGYFFILPPSLGFLLDFGSSIAEPNIRIGNYVNFVTRMLGIMGLVFETPLIVMGMAMIGVVNWRKLLGWWRFAIVLAFVISAIATPTIDPITQSLVAGPIVALYFVGIALAWLVRRN
ncbi:MAG: twin-arginine translocase subunit TatC [Chloroflexi bacterium]|nr:MAG: twin-arginine translocase subunit TatC [Chloroflexota bacterium]